MFKGLDGLKDRYNLNGSPITRGNVVIEPFTITEEQALHDNAMYFRDKPRWMEIVPGEYVVLKISGETVMSDTPMEKTTNAGIILNATGNVLIAGLGIGLLLHNLLPKLLSGKVTTIQVIEKNEELIQVIRPYFRDLPVDKVMVTRADIFEWLPAPGTKYDTIYFDIWTDICSYNYLDMKVLHKRFRKYLVKGGYMDSWLRDHCKSRYQVDKYLYL